MATLGTVRDWTDDEGWGVIDSSATPGGCWTHFSHLAVPGYHTLRAGQVVEMEWETPGQDGYPYRAVRVWPQGHEPADARPDMEGGLSSGHGEAVSTTVAVDTASVGRMARW